MKVLVTGAAGFIGSWVMKELPKYGMEPVGTDCKGNEGVIVADVTDFNQILRTFEAEKPDAVIHLAAISGSTGKNEAEQSLRQPYLNFTVNIQGSLNIAEACRICQTSRVVYMSTFAVYGRVPPNLLPIDEDTPTMPEHAYAVSKLAGEGVFKTYALDFGVNTVVVRAPFIAGEGQSEMNVLREFIDDAFAGRDLVVFGSGRHKREFLHPADLVNGFVKMLEFANERKFETFVLGNTPITIKELAAAVAESFGAEAPNYRSSNSDRAFDQTTNFEKAERILGWTPEVPVREIIRRIMANDYGVTPKV